ncbi:MAG: hypothetical protein CM1200mP18_17170 [Gammaproteobacteria bacterium]|nr:MAG: hypothetical protein CM1200mP18_17170 [Gammaproteobacteria bacterium]
MSVTRVCSFFCGAGLYPQSLTWRYGFFWDYKAIGTYLGTRGYRLASASVIAPFEYVAMPCAVVWGLMLYSESPDRVAVIGIILIIGSGLYVMRPNLINKPKFRSCQMIWVSAHKSSTTKFTG